MNGLTLAYIGDAYYELIIRKYLLKKGFTNTKILHNLAVQYTSGNTQGLIMKYLLKQNFLKEEEIEAFKKGRNNNHKKVRKDSLELTILATGFESLIGYLGLNDETRMMEIINYAINFVESNLEEKGE